jgi:methylmalonyl-CoA carboxyltransferase 1.3S subunit
MLLKVTVDGVVYEVEVEVEEDPRPPLGTIFMGGGFVPQHAATPAAPPQPRMGRASRLPWPARSCAWR